MELRRLGMLEVSVVGLGCNNFGMAIEQGPTNLVVNAALDAGINYFDTAESYGQGESEVMLGKALGARRADVLVATKWGHTASLTEGQRAGDPAHIRACLDASLTRLGMDYVDHYQLHRPDPDTPIEETQGCLAELQAEGKIREIGCTHHTSDELRAANSAAGVPPYPSIQNHYSLLTRAPETDGVLAACADLGVAFVPYFPLESGLLTGKYSSVTDIPEDSRFARWGKRSKAFIDEDKLATVEQLHTWAESKGHTLLELAMSWLVSNPLVTSVIAGATKPEQVASNVAAAGWAMTEAERAEVDAILAG